MRSVAVAQEFPGTVHEAESCWYDISAWPGWVDGCDHVVSVDESWPEPGASVIWQSGPAGRGRVVETVTSHEPLAGLTVKVSDDSIDGTQQVSFSPLDHAVGVTLLLRYEIKQRGLFTPLVDILFIRRAMETSLRSTLRAFGAELSARRS